MRNPHPSRRAALASLGAGLGVAVVVGSTALAAVNPKAAPYRVTMLGDSITAGYGLGAGQAVPAKLQAELIRTGTPVQVTAAGVSGDTSAAGRQRAAFSVKPGAQLCIVALGGNDLLQGLDVKAMERNLTAIVVGLKQRRIAVLLAGLRAPPILGAAYAADFNAVFARVAKAQGVPLYPDLLAGVSGNAALIQDDGIHPNAAGAQVIAARLAPVVAQALKRTASRGAK
jgi:acyl-CoA thioesterase-1